MTDERFRWHADAVLTGRDNRFDAPEGGAHAVLSDRPAAACLAAAMARAAGGQPFRITAGDASDPAPENAETFQVETGGTLSAPKIVERSQASWCATFGLGHDAEDRSVVAIPGRLSHSLALYGAVEGLQLGARVHLLDGMRPDRWAPAIAAAEATMVWATPAQLRLLRGRAASVRRVMVGGAAFDAPTRTHAETIFPNARLTPFYGSTEQSFVALADQTTPAGAAGRSVPGVEIDIRDGEIWTASPWIFSRYAAGADPRTRRDGRFVTVGDRGRLEDGMLWVDGRSGRSVTIADRVVPLDTVEAVLAALPGITAAAVVAVADPKRGHRLTAFVAGTPDGAAALTLLRREFGIAAPRTLTIVEDWPLLASGKTDLARLEAMAR